MKKIYYWKKGGFTETKRKAFFIGAIVICVFFVSLPAYAWETLVTTTQAYYTGYFTSFYYQSGNNVFKEPNGTIHVAYVENYELWYLKSTDGGTTWTKEKIPTGHDGDIRCSTMVVDHEGTVFIGLTCNDRFNYSNPTGVTYGYEFYYDLYCVNNKSGPWSVETIYKPYRTGWSDNYGPLAMAMIVDSNNEVHLFANRYGWWTYGGTAWEWIRSAGTDTWGSRITVVSFSDTGVDKSIYSYYRPVVDTDGTITLIMSRHRQNPGIDDRLFYVQKAEGGSWSSQTEIDQLNRSYACYFQFDAAIDGDGHINLIYYKDDGEGYAQIHFSTDFGPTDTIYTASSSEERIYDLKLHSDVNANLTAFIRRSDQNCALANRPSGGSWSPLFDLPTSAPDGDVFSAAIAQTDTRSGVFTDFKMTYLDRPLTGGPYGPDNFYFYDRRCLCDLSNDGQCDMEDWLLFGEDWGRTDCHDIGVECECDLNDDGQCDMEDWLLFGEDWGRTDCPIL